MSSLPSNDPVDVIPQPTSWLRRGFRWIVRAIGNAFCLASLIGLLAFVAAIPVIQLVSLGYLLHVAGAISAGKTVGESLVAFRQAGLVGLAITALFLASLPTQLLVHWESVSVLVDPETSVAGLLRIAAIGSSLLALAYLMWAWVRGGKPRHYLWPQPKRFVREAFRPSTWLTAPDRLWDFTSSFELPRLFWLGLRGAIGTLVWLIPAMLIILANRNGRTGLAGLVGVLSLAALGVSMLYVPMLQANFASKNRLAALFNVRQVRSDFRRAPWAWLGAMIVSLVLTPIPLYLLKVEATPAEFVWLPCLFFVAFMLPARVCQGLAIRRSRRKDAEPTGRWAFVSRWAVRIMMPVVVAIYLLFVYLSQYTSWDGLQTWVQQHAILVPVPFVGV